MVKLNWKHYLLVITATGERRKLPATSDRIARDLARQRLAEDQWLAGFKSVTREDYHATDWEDDCIEVSRDGVIVAILYRGDKGQWTHANTTKK